MSAPGSRAGRESRGGTRCDARRQRLWRCQADALPLAQNRGGGARPAREQRRGEAGGARAQVCRLVSHPVVKRDFAALLAGGEGDKRQVAALADLLERLTALDPDRRGPAPA